MGRFNDQPPIDAVPRALPELPTQAQLPLEFQLPDPEADPTGHVPVEPSNPSGLPEIPAENFQSHYPGEHFGDDENPFSDFPWA